MRRKNYIYNIAWGKTENFLKDFTIQKYPKNGELQQRLQRATL
jgi:hypothetical protein